MYIAHYSLQDWIEEAAADNTHTIRLQDASMTRMEHQGLVAYQTSLILLSRIDANGHIQLARIEVETMDRMKGEGTKGMAERCEEAYQLVRAALRQAMPDVRILRGVYQEAGLSESLHRIHSSQELWTLGQVDKHDARTRFIKPLHETITET